MLSRQSSRLAAKYQQPDEPDPPPILPPQKKKVKKTAAEATRDWKKRMENNTPEKYADYQEKCRQSSKAYRLSCTEERRAIQREQTKLRMRALRERKKLEQKHTEKPMNTRAAKEEQRAKWRKQKQEWWGNKTESQQKQKRRRLNEARRIKYKVQQLAATSKSIKSSPLMVTPQSHDMDMFDIKDSRTPAARRKAVSRTRHILPSSPRRFARKLSDLLLSATPRKKALFSFKLKTGENSLEEKVGKQVLENLRSLSKVRSKATQARRNVLMSVCLKYRSLRKNSSLLGIHRKTVSKMINSNILSPKMVRKTRKLQKEVATFFDSVSNPLPEKKLVSKKTGKCASTLSIPLTELHATFLEESGKKISFSHFAKCRPSNVKLMQQCTLRQCLCEYCANVNLKLRAVNGIAARVNNICRIKHLYHAVDIITCGRIQGAWQKTCAYRECNICNINKLDDHLRPLLQHQERLTWTKWEFQTNTVKGKKVFFV